MKKQSILFCMISVIASICRCVSGHSFLTSPISISTMDGCRIGGTGGFIGNCPGPCPNINIAADAHPSNPTATFLRGHYHRVVWSRNNHEGGFVRWTMVPLDKMHSKQWHDKMAFHYNCWSIGRFNCNEFDFHRDCNYDRDNEAYSKMLYIPPIYPDGDYILGWTWFGGGVGFGHFGDYYDCAYVRVSGGEPLQETYTPVFEIGADNMHENGCEATVDRLGICWKEPCTPIRKTDKRVPTAFKNGTTPEPILSEWYGDHVSVSTSTVKFEGLRLIDTTRDIILDVDLTYIVNLNRNDEISLLAHTSGDVEYVQWYTNGKMRGADYEMPFTIAGDRKGDFYPWMYPLFHRRTRVTVKVVGKDGSFCWGNVELRFQETSGPGASDFSGTTWEEYEANSGKSTGEEDKTSDPATMVGEPIQEEEEQGNLRDSETSVIIDKNTELSPTSDPVEETTVTDQSESGAISPGSQISDEFTEVQNGDDAVEPPSEVASNMNPSPSPPFQQSAPGTSATTGTSSASVLQIRGPSSPGSSISNSIFGINSAQSAAGGMKRGEARSSSTSASTRFVTSRKSREDISNEVDRATADFA